MAISGLLTRTYSLLPQCYLACIPAVCVHHVIQTKFSWGMPAMLVSLLAMSMMDNCMHLHDDILTIYNP